MVKENARWVLVLAIPDGHRYFRERSTGRVAVADNSGSWPENTDDGVLYIDPSRPVIATFDTASVPVTRGPERKEESFTWTGEEPLGALRVAQTFGLTFEARGPFRTFLDTWDSDRAKAGAIPEPVPASIATAREEWERVSAEAALEIEAAEGVRVRLENTIIRHRAREEAAHRRYLDAVASVALAPPTPPATSFACDLCGPTFIGRCPHLPEVAHA